MKDTIRNWLAEQFGEDEELFKELYGQYSTDMKANAAELPGKLSAGDAAALGEIGHAMKGMALQMGDSEVAEIGVALQNAGRGGDLAGCASAIERMLPAVAAL